MALDTTMAAILRVLVRAERDLNILGLTPTQLHTGTELELNRSLSSINAALGRLELEGYVRVERDEERGEQYWLTARGNISYYLL